MRRLVNGSLPSSTEKANPKIVTPWRVNLASWIIRIGLAWASRLDPKDDNEQEAPKRVVSLPRLVQVDEDIDNSILENSCFDRFFWRQKPCVDISKYTILTVLH